MTTLLRGSLGIALALLALSLYVSPAHAATTVTGDIPDGTVWDTAGSPYIISNASVRVPPGSTLTILPGTVVKFSDDRGLTVEGSLVAEGEEGNEIYFTSIHDDEVGGDANGNGTSTIPAHQDWQQVRIFENGQATIRHAVIRYGGLPQPPSGLSNCSPTLRHCRGALTNIGTLNLSDSKFAQNYEHDVYHARGVSDIERSEFEHATNIGPSVRALAGEMTVRNSTIRGGRYGISADPGVQTITLTGNQFANQGLYAASIDASVDFVHTENVSVDGVGRGFKMLGSVVGERMWTPDTIPYVIETQNVRVPSGATLTIEPGAVIKFLNSALEIDGSLYAHGSEDQQIYFTSIHDDSVGGDTNDNGAATVPGQGQWQQLRVFSTGRADLSHVVLGYGGAPYRPGLNNCGVGVQTCRGVITNTGVLMLTDAVVATNTGYGFYQTLGSSTIARSRVVNHTSAPAILVSGGLMSIHQSSLSPNASRGIDAAVPVDATNNWWGDATGPFHSSLNPGGLGVGVSNNVAFTPWLGADPFVEEPEPELDPLILQYEPILYFHPDEDFYPMNVEAFIEASALWDDRGLLEDEQLIPAGEVTVDDIANTNSEDWYLAFSTPDAPKHFSPAVASTTYEILVNSGKAMPTYYAHMMDQGDWTVLQYWYFYAFNSWLEHGGRNNHEGDWESVFIFLDKDTKEPKHVAFSVHLNDGDAEVVNPSQYDSVRRDWNEEEIDLIGQNVKSFVAAGSHANYPMADDHMVGRFVDQASVDGISYSGSTWQGRNQILASVPLWMLYKGKWGSDGPLLPGSDGPTGPAFIDVNLFSSLKRFEEPVKWAGLDKISTHSGDGSASELAFENQTTNMSFSEPVPVGETVTSDQHDELITFGNLDAVNLLPRFWDFSASLPNGSFEVDVELGYTDEEVEALGLSEEKLSAFLYDEENSVWNPVASLVDALANTISFKTTHFSRYAIGQLVVTNEPPVLDPIGDQTVGEGDTLEFTISATDPDEGDTLTYAAANLPEDASFDPATRTFYWNTDYDDAGNYTDIEFTVTDDGEPLGLDVELITITVGDVNRAPVFENPGPQEILEDERLDMVIGAFDPDGDAVELAALNLLERASFSTSTGEFSWKPTRSQEGVYVLTFVASDDGEPQASATLDIVITVGDNPTPIELADQLIALVLSYQLPQEIENAYLANLKKVPTFIEEGKIAPAAQQLEAFMQKVEMDYKKGKIHSEMKNALLEYAGDLLAGLDID